MALSIKTDEADRLARELASATHESITEAIRSLFGSGSLASAASPDPTS